MKPKPKICLNCAKAAITGGMIGYATKERKFPYECKYRYCVEKRKYFYNDETCENYKPKLRIRLWKLMYANLNYRAAKGLTTAQFS